MSWVVGLPSNSYKPITNTAWVRAWLCILQKRCTLLAAASDTVYQLPAHDRWFSPGTPASSTIKTGRHDIAEILLKVALNTKNQINPVAFKSRCPGWFIPSPFPLLSKKKTIKLIFAAFCLAELRSKIVKVQ
jgi:hypothetical protein